MNQSIDLRDTHPILKKTGQWLLFATRSSGFTHVERKRKALAILQLRISPEFDILFVDPFAKGVVHPFGRQRDNHQWNDVRRSIGHFTHDHHEWNSHSTDVNEKGRRTDYGIETWSNSMFIGHATFVSKNGQVLVFKCDLFGDHAEETTGNDTDRDTRHDQTRRSPRSNGENHQSDLNDQCPR